MTNGGRRQPPLPCRRRPMPLFDAAADGAEVALTGVELVFIVLGAGAVIAVAARLIGRDPALPAVIPAGTGAVGRDRGRLVSVGRLVEVGPVVGVAGLIGIARLGIAGTVVGIVRGAGRRRAHQRAGAKADRRRRDASVARLARARRHRDGA